MIAGPFETEPMQHSCSLPLKVGVPRKPSRIIASTAMMNAGVIQSNVFSFKSNLHLAILSIHILTTL